MAIRLKLRGRGPELRAVHEALSLAGLAAIVVHGVSLIGDRYLHPSLADIAVPFSSPYRTGWTAAGVVAGWSLVLLGLSYYARGRIGAARWRRLHRVTTLAWALGVVHSLGEGTDAGQTWFLAMTATVAVPALVLVLLRWGRSAGESGSARRGPSGTERRQLEDYPGAPKPRVGHAHAAAMGLGDGLHDREPQPRPAAGPAPRRVRTVEPIEDSGALFDWDPGAVVFDREADVPGTRLDG